MVLSAPAIIEGCLSMKWAGSIRWINNSLVNSQKGSDTRVCVSIYFDATDSKSGNRLALSDPVSYRRHYVVGFSSHF